MSDTFVQSQTFRVINKGTSAAPGNGVPFYKNSLLHQTRYHRGYNRKPPVMYGLTNATLPFQIWIPGQAITFRIADINGTTVKTLSTSTDLRIDCFDGYYIHTHVGMTLTPADDCGAWRYYEITTDKGNTYYSEIWENIDSTDDQFKGWVKLLFTDWDSTTYDPQNFLDYIFYGTATNQYKPFFIFEPHWGRPFNDEVNDSFLDGNEVNQYTFRKITERQRFSVAVNDCLLPAMHQIGKHQTVQFTLIGDSLTYTVNDMTFEDESDINDYVGKGTFIFSHQPFVSTGCKEAPILECYASAGLVIDQTNQTTTGINVRTTGSTYGSQNNISNDAGAAFVDEFFMGNGVTKLFDISFNPTTTAAAFTFNNWHGSITAGDQTVIQNAFSGTGANYTFKDNEDGLFAAITKTGVLSKAVWDAVGSANRTISRTVTYSGDTSAANVGSLSDTLYGYVDISSNSGTFAWTDIDQRCSYRSNEADEAYHASGAGSFSFGSAGNVTFWGLKECLTVDVNGSSLVTDLDFTKSELGDGCNINLSNCVNLLAAQVDQIYIDLDVIDINGPYAASTIDTSGTTGNATGTSSTARANLAANGITINV